MAPVQGDPPKKEKIRKPKLTDVVAEIARELKAPAATATSASLGGGVGVEQPVDASLSLDSTLDAVIAAALCNPEEEEASSAAPPANKRAKIDALYLLMRETPIRLPSYTEDAQSSPLPPPTYATLCPVPPLEVVSVSSDDLNPWAAHSNKRDEPVFEDAGKPDLEWRLIHSYAGRHRYMMNTFAELIGEKVMESALENCGECPPEEGCPFVHMYSYRGRKPSRRYRLVYNNVSALIDRFYQPALDSFLQGSLLPSAMRLIGVLEDQCVPGANRMKERAFVHLVADWLMGTDWTSSFDKAVLETAVKQYLLKRACLGD